MWIEIPNIDSQCNLPKNQAARPHHLGASFPRACRPVSEPIFLQRLQFRELDLHVIKSIEDAKALEDVEVGVSDWIVIDQQMINRFAEATGDYQWIHVDEERAARELPNGKTIAHGYLTLSLIPNLTVDFVHVENLTRAINLAGLDRSHGRASRQRHPS